MCIDFTVHASVVINPHNSSVLGALAARWCFTETLHMPCSRRIQISVYRFPGSGNSSRARSGLQMLFSPELHVRTGKSTLTQVKDYRYQLYHQAAKWGKQLE